MASSGGSSIGGIIGAIVGSFIPGVGPVIGYSIGSFIGGVVDPAVIDGPRLSDLRVQNSTYGASEAICYGGVRLAGNVIWSTDLVEHESQGGKGGPETNNFSYTVSCAINICAGEHQSIRRIWEFSKLVYDATDTASAESLEASAAFAEFFVFYTGSETQLADPTMEAALGVGNVSGYRGSTYVVFTDLPCTRGVLPSFSFELSSQTQGAACTVPGVINDLLAAQGSGPESGSVILTWSAASGATYYDIYVSKDGADAVKINGIPWTTLTTGHTVTPWDLKAIYTYWVVAVNTCGETRGNDQATRWVGTINGTGTWNAGQWVTVCHDYYFDAATGYYGVGNPGSQTFGNICYRYYAGNYAGSLVSTGIAFENLGGLFAVGGGATIGIVAASSTFLSTIITDIGTRCGLNSARNDVSALTAIVVDGYIVGRQMSGRSACEPLQRAYYVDVVESGNGIKWVVRGGASAVTIGYDDLGAAEGEAEETAVVPLRAQETDLPSRVNVAYMAKTRDFETGAQTDRRMTTGSQQVVSIELPIVMSDLKGKQVASVLMYDAWTSRNQRSWSTTRKYAKYEPTDIFTLDDDQFVYNVRATEKSEEGPVIKWKGVDDSVAGYSPNVIAATGYSSSTIRFRSGTMRLELLDVPIVQDADDGSGYYAAGGSL